MLLNTYMNKKPTFAEGGDDLCRVLFDGFEGKAVIRSVATCVQRRTNRNTRDRNQYTHVKGKARHSNHDRIAGQKNIGSLSGRLYATLQHSN